MTEDTDLTAEVEAEETTEEVGLAVEIAQIAGFLAVTAGAVLLTRKVFNRFHRKPVLELVPPFIDATSTEV